LSLIKNVNYGWATTPQYHTLECILNAYYRATFCLWHWTVSFPLFTYKTLSRHSYAELLKCFSFMWQNVQNVSRSKTMYEMPVLLLLSSLENRNKLQFLTRVYHHYFATWWCYFVLQRLSQTVTMKTTPATVCHAVFWVSSLFFFSFLACCYIICLILFLLFVMYFFSVLKYCFYPCLICRNY